MARANISKSTYLKGLQCQKLLWHLKHKPELFEEQKNESDPILEQGNAVGVLAQRLFPGGIGISWDLPISDRIRETQKAIPKMLPIYEATFSSEGMYCQVDILSPAPRDSWDINEVKSTTGVKDVHLPDISFQKHACEASGLKIRRCNLVHIDSDYIRRGDISPKDLFAVEDVTGLLKPHQETIEDNLAEMRNTLGLKSAPKIGIGPHCNDPYECPLIGHCWKHVPTHSVFDLYRGGKTAWELHGDDVLGMADIPDGFRLTPIQRIQVESVRQGKPIVDSKAIRCFLAGLKYPLHFLDFETINPAIPLFDGTRPYQQIPFQFSLHIQDKPGAEPRHVSWLAGSPDDPRPRFLEALKGALGTKGDILAYNMSFELGVLNALTTAFPKHGSWLAKVGKRFVDLLMPFRNFHYYHPDQHGSCSIKDVLPALTGKGYDGMEITDGGTASSEFMRVTYGDVSDAERTKVRGQLEQYCQLDTLGMVWILEELAGLTGA